MKTDKRSEYLTRSGILSVLSDDEVARVSTAETAASLSEGEEYLDLEHLEQGVRRAKRGAPADLGNVLTKSAVERDTWNRILTKLAPKGTGVAQSSR